MDYIQPYLDYFSQHPGWAIAIVFLIAFGEALLIIGLFVPSTAVLVGAGMLVGTGHLAFWPVFLATASGAILGDQLSYWAGRLFGERLKTMWPLNRYPVLVGRGEEFARRHGGKSIAIGRFVPGVKAVVPGIVGMFGMGQVYFASVNVTSGLIWTAAHLFPGMLLGQGLALAGELSGRLVIVLLVLLALLAIAGWVIRLVIGGLGPLIEGAQRRMSIWALARPGRSARRFGELIAPEHPGSAAIIIFSFLIVTTLIAFLSLMNKVFGGSTLIEADISIYNMMQSLRNAPGDEIMIMITMLGDWQVMVVLAAAIILWLAWRRAWEVALAVALTVLSARLFVPIMKVWLQRARPVGIYDMWEAFSFPSGHTTFATVTLGVLAVLASHSLRSWGKSLVFAATGLAVIAIAYSRIYLGAHWLSDVAGGFLFGIAMIAAFGIAVEAVPPRRIKPLGLALASLAALLIAGSIHIARDYDLQAQLYERQEAIVLYDVTQWAAGGWASVGLQRVDLAGRSEEPFLAQWAGDVAPLEHALAASGWTARPRWSWSHAIAYLDPNRLLKDVEPGPALHRGRKADVTLTRPVTNATSQRLVLRAWRTDFQIAKAGKNYQLYVVSVMRERLRKGFSLYAVPSPVPATAEDRASLLATLGALPGAIPVTGVGLGKGDSPLLLDAASLPRGKL